MRGPALWLTKKELNIVVICAMLGLIAALIIDSYHNADAQQAMGGPPCIYEVLVSGDNVTVAWTPPPCDANLEPRNPTHHNLFKHASVKMAACGAIAIYRWSDIGVPVADTLFHAERTLCPELGPRITDGG